MEIVWIDGQQLTIETVMRVAKATPDAIEVRLTAAAEKAVRRAQEAVARFVSDGKLVYGITTGFGAFKNKRISPDEVQQLQHNILMSHAVGVGYPLPEEEVRAMMLIRANALARGYSGIRLQTLQYLLAMLNRGIHPVVPRQGSLGASGDLAPLAHMSLPLIGLGEVIYRGERLTGAEGLARIGLQPLRLAAKEGLALTNGTAMMAALGCFAVVEAENAAGAANIAGALSLEALHGTPRAFDPRLHALRPHPRQIEVAGRMRELLAGSTFLRGLESSDVQDAYTLRCIPQVHGACQDAIAYTRWVLETELNSVTDNPLIFFDETGQAEAISGGNFHGEPLAIAFDYLGLAMTELGNMSERRLARLTDGASNQHVLPDFLTEHGGLNSGFMLTQYTAASLASENKALVHPASADTIPTSANWEDHNSNGPIAVRQARRIIRNLENILALEMMAAAQGIDFRRQQMGTDHRLGRGTAAAYRLVRRAIPFLPRDVVMYPHMEQARRLVAEGTLVAAVQTALAGEDAT